ncbi:MAG: hypothetical protein O7D91_03820 [Planctomycetota bacterium]|nr:hypothetical protein [Planctomycetota bacterium]
MLVKSKAHFRIYAILGLVLILVIGTLCRSGLSRQRWTELDFGVLLPIGFCAAVAISPMIRIRWSSRAIFGFFQSISLLSVHWNHYGREIVDGDLYSVLRELMILIMFYTVTFATVTQTVVIVVTWLRPEKKSHICENCEYNLTGLTVPRCPECGTKFDPALLTALGDASKPDEPS